MSEQKRNKAGLQKGISSIFKGVRIPQNGGGQEPCGTPAPERTDNTGTKQQLPKSQVPKAYQATQTLHKAAPEHTGYTGPKPPAQKPQPPKVYQVTQSLPKAAPAQQPKAAPAQQPKADTDDIKKYPSEKRIAVKTDSPGLRQQIKDKLFKPKPGVSTAKQKVMVVMMPLLFIALIFMLLRGGVFGTSAGKKEAVAENNASGVATVGSNNEIEWEIPAPYPTTLRDPIRLVPAAASQTEQGGTGEIMKLIVRSILYSEDNPSAVIGSRIVHEGEKIQGVSVIKINTDSVEFEMNGKNWTQMVQR